MKTIFAAVILMVVIFGIWFLYPNVPQQKNEIPTSKWINEVSYVCGDSKTIHAKYFISNRVKVAPNGMPILSDSVDIILSDGRTLSLPQTISASGTRYANKDESFVFWSKGNGAFLLENDKQTYGHCVMIRPKDGTLSEVYVDSIKGFSIRYPAGYSVNRDYKYNAFGPGKEINGVKFTIPSTLSTGTNLSGYDTGISIEEIPNIQNCDASLFIYPGAQVASITDVGTEYSVASTTDAGAGNFYEEKVWAIPGTNPCMAVRYFIHSTNIQNYPAGTVREFDRDTLLGEFDAIRRMLTLNPLN